MGWVALAAGPLLLLHWGLLCVFFVTRNETADRIATWVSVPALAAIGVAMGAVLDRYGGDAPVLVAVITAVGLAAVALSLGLGAALALGLAAFPRIAAATTLAWAILLLWVGAAGGFVVAYGGLPAWLGWLGIAAVVYAVAIIGALMANSDTRRGAPPGPGYVAAGVPVLLLVPMWFIALGWSLVD